MKNLSIKQTKIDYDGGLSYKAQLCRITGTVPESHPTDLELIYCLKGNVELICGEQHFKLSAGDIYSIDNAEIHYLSAAGANNCEADSNNNDACDNLVLIFNIDIAKEATDPLAAFGIATIPWFACEANHCHHYQQEGFIKLKDAILALSAAQFAGTASSSSTDDAVKALIDTLIKYFDWFSYNNYDLYVNEDLRSRFYRSLDYCAKNYKNKITATDLAEREHINPNYFSQFLTTTVFTSFSHMVKYMRCYRAEHLLLRTDMPNYEIAYAVGFSDPKYFYGAFEFFWHRSPKEHRQMYANHIKLCEELSKSGKGTTVLPPREAAEIIEKYITKWHLQKLLR